MKEGVLFGEKRADENGRCPLQRQLEVSTTGRYRARNFLEGLIKSWGRKYSCSLSLFIWGHSLENGKHFRGHVTSWGRSLFGGS